MTAITQARMNVAVALVIPALGLAYLTFGASIGANPSAAGAVVALGVLWMTATVAVQVHSPPSAVDVTRGISQYFGRREGVPGVVDVSRPSVSWRWTSVLRAPLELLAVAWGVPIVILLIVVPIGLAIASLLWLGRLIVNL